MHKKVLFSYAIKNEEVKDKNFNAFLHFNLEFEIKDEFANNCVEILDKGIKNAYTVYIEH